MIKVSLLKENEITNNLYSIEESEDFLQSIIRSGILEPLIVRPTNDKLFEVISGNRRLRAAKKLNIQEVPVIIKPVESIDEITVVDHQQQRIKRNSEIIIELRVIRESSKISQGKRSDLSTKANDGRIKLNELKKTHTKTKIDRLTTISNLIDELYGEDEKKVKQELKKLDNGTVKGSLDRLRKRKQNKENFGLIGDSFEIHDSGFTVYNKSSDKLLELDSNSVQLAFCSPPFFQMRDYSIGDIELGQEKTVEEYASRLVDHFKECKRVLSKNGTLWVNLGDYSHNGCYAGVPENFLILMLKEGWLLHDKYVWIKNNPAFCTSNKAVLAHETIFVFKRNKKIKYNPNWVEDYNVEGVKLELGNVKLRSVFDFRDNTIITNSSNTHSLKRACKKEGVHLTHSATFPLSIPTIGILTSTAPGDTVLDLFNGTGTTGRSAKLLGRNYVGYDLNPTYVKQTEIRMNMDIEQDVELIKKAA